MSLRPWPAVAVAAALAGLGAGCNSGGGHSLVLYNGQHPQLTSALVRAFERQTGIDVRVRTDDSIVLADQILQEGGVSAADVYLAENSPELTTLDEHRLLGRLQRSTLQQVPDRYRARTGDWVGIALRVGSLAYSPQLLASQELPSSLLQLAQPEWRGKIALAPTDSDFVPLVGAVIATYGEGAAVHWLAGLRRNARTYQNDESVAAAVNRGDVATGLINSYYWFRLRLELGRSATHSELHYFPNHDVGSIENTSGAAVLASTAHRRDAEAFIRFLVSARAERIISQSDDFEYPTRSGISPNGALPPLQSIAPASLAPSALGDDQPASKLIQRSGLV
jgi:iron(III) transport system substrate-binding protein